MKKATAITLLILLTVSVGSSVYLLLDQKNKNKLIVDKDALLLKQLKMISEITGETKKLATELTQATQAAKVGGEEYKTLESERDFLKIKITSAESKKLQEHISGKSNRPFEEDAEDNAANKFTLTTKKFIKFGIVTSKFGPYIALYSIMAIFEKFFGNSFNTQ